LRIKRGELDQHFTRLLEFLCPEDPEEAGRRYIRLHQKLEGYFRFRGVSDPVADADETLNRAARRIEEGADVSDIDKYCLGIARHVVEEGWRKNAREHSAFLEYLERQNRDSDHEEVDRTTKLMQLCFARLEQHERDLLNSYCAAPTGRARAQYRRELAESRNWTISALRIRVTRLRQGLDDCLRALSRNQ